MDRESILRMAGGAFEEKVDAEVAKVIDNIIDPNTKPDAKRKITVTLEFQPDAERKHISLFVSVKSALCPPSPAATSMVITADGNGEMVVAELTPQIPGQVNMEGAEQAPPKILKLVNNG